MLDIVVSTYNQRNELPCLLYSLACQTRKDFRVLVFHDGIDVNNQQEEVMSIAKKTELKLLWFNTLHRYADWGHSLRKLALEQYVENPFVLFTNGDNYYMPKMVEWSIGMMENQIGVLYFDCVHSHNHPINTPLGEYGYFKSEFRPCGCDIGAMIIRTDIAKAVGWNHTNRDADAEFIREILEYQKTNDFKIVKVDKVLFVHN